MSTNAVVAFDGKDGTKNKYIIKKKLAIYKLLANKHMYAQLGTSRHKMLQFICTYSNIVGHYYKQGVI